MFTNDNIAHLGDAERGEGTIRRLITDRGFGFIRPARAHGTTQKDLFFHASQVVGCRYEELREDDFVRYTLADDGHGKGPVATNVERIKRASGFRDETEFRKLDEPAPGRWSLAPGQVADEEDDNTYDWGATG